MNTLPVRLRNIRARQQGFSLPELLVVLAIIGIAVAIGIPLVAENVRQARIRAAADQLAMDIKAARMIAVTKRSPLDFTVSVEPSNSYQYTDNRGRVRFVSMPDGVKITASDSPITFQINGSLAAAATTVLEIELTADALERWTISTNIMGVSTTKRERIAT